MWKEAAQMIGVCLAAIVVLALIVLCLSNLRACSDNRATDKINDSIHRGQVHREGQNIAAGEAFRAHYPQVEVLVDEIDKSGVLSPEEKDRLEREAVRRLNQSVGVK